MKTISLTKISLLIGALFLAQTHAAHAFEVAKLKEDGVACEGTDGYLRVLKSSPEVESFVKDKNAQRREAYKEIAKKTGASIEDTGKLTASKLNNLCN